MPDPPSPRGLTPAVLPRIAQDTRPNSGSESLAPAAIGRGLDSAESSMHRSHVLEHPDPDVRLRLLPRFSLAAGMHSAHRPIGAAIEAPHPRWSSSTPNPE